MEYIRAIVATPHPYDSAPLIQWMLRHIEVPIFAVGIYLWFIFSVGPKIKNPIPCRPLFALWNLFLATFSILGATYTVPSLAKTISNHGLLGSFCHDPLETFYQTDAGYWVALFILSKIPELIDTVFLVIQKKPVIFLHWYHHVTVCLYCWHTYTHYVHAIMYSYYFFMAVNLKMLVKPLAPLITSLQILQMVFGVVITTVVLLVQDDDEPSKCATVGSNARLGWVMYFSYLILFGQLFVNSYLRKKPKTKSA